ncbi:MAG: UDP-N-acetylglucosamine 2-epimerase [Lentisphaerae bacterium]|nr:UDP-N-acetylglucosamine 2-epimerase [Lentisphaerota bacterium]
MRTIGVVTVARSDYGIYVPVLKHLQQTPALATWLFVTGAHLEARFGLTVREIEADGYPIRERIPLHLDGDAPAAIATAMGRGVAGFAEALARSRPDVLLVLGDRFDMLPAAVAALPLRIPVAHLHGGEVTEGAMDESIRHAITKLSHLHFPSTSAYAQNLRQLGEEPWRITLSGAPSLDNVVGLPRLTPGVLADRIGMPVESPLLVTYHPATLQRESSAQQIAEVIRGLEAWPGQIVFTGVNMDPGNRAIHAAMAGFAARRPNTRYVENLGSAAYFSLMAVASAMVGNSSSGIIEAASFRLPVVDIGPRQQGRQHGANVLHAPCAAAEIAAAIRQAASPAFRASLGDLVNPYGDGHAAERIVERLRTVALDDTLLVKRFCQWAPS